MTYTLFNLAFVTVCCAVAAFRLRSGGWRRAIQTAAFVTALAYPWDYFAGSLRVWTYENPGLRLRGVPLNDLVFIFFGTILAASVLARRVLGSDANADAKDC